MRNEVTFQRKIIHETFAEINNARDVSNLNVRLNNKHIFCTNIKEHSTHLQNTVDMKISLPKRHQVC